MLGNLTVRITPGDATLVEFVHTAPAPPSNVHFLYKCCVYSEHNQTVYISGLSEQRSFFIATPWVGKFVVLAEMRAVVEVSSLESLAEDIKKGEIPAAQKERRQLVETFKSLRNAQSAAVQLAAVSQGKQIGNVLEVFYDAIAGEPWSGFNINAMQYLVQADAAQYACQLARQIFDKAGITTECHVDDLSKEFASAVGSLSLHVRRDFEVSADLLRPYQTQNALYNTPYAGLFIYRLPNIDAENRIRLSLHPSGKLPQQYCVYSKPMIRFIEAVLVPGLPCGSRVLHQTRRTSPEMETSAVILQEQNPFEVKSPVRLGFKVAQGADPNASHGKTLQVWALFQGISEQFALGLTCDGLLNYAMPLTASVQFSKQFKTSQWATAIPEHVRQLRAHVRLLGCAKNGFFYTAPGLAADFHRAGNALSDSPGVKDASFNKQLQKRTMVQGNACGIISLTGLPILQLQLNCLRDQAQRAGFQLNPEEIISGCSLELQQFQLVLLIRSSAVGRQDTNRNQSASFFHLFLIANMDQLVNIVPLDPEEICGAAPQAPFDMQPFGDQKVIVGFPQFVACIDASSGELIFTFADQKKQFVHVLDMHVTQSLLNQNNAPSTPRLFTTHRDSVSSGTKAQLFQLTTTSSDFERQPRTLTSEFLPTSCTEESEEFLSPDENAALNTEHIRYQFTPQYVPQHKQQRQRLAAQPKQPTTQVDEILAMRTARYHQERFLAIIQFSTQKTQLLAQWFLIQPTKSTLIGEYVLGAQRPVYTSIACLVDSMLFAVSWTKESTQITELGLFRELRRQVELSKAARALEFPFALLGKTGQEGTWG